MSHRNPPLAVIRVSCVSGVCELCEGSEWRLSLQRQLGEAERRRHRCSHAELEPRSCWGGGHAAGECHVIMFRRLELQPGLDVQQRGRPLLTCGDVILIWILWAESPAASCQSMQTISCGGAEAPTGLSVKETWITLCCDWSAASNRLFRVCLLFWTNDEESKSFQTAEGSTANIRFLKNVWFRFYCQSFIYICSWNRVICCLLVQGGITVSCSV